MVAAKSLVYSMLLQMVSDPEKLFLENTELDAVHPCLLLGLAGVRTLEESMCTRNLLVEVVSSENE